MRLIECRFTESDCWRRGERIRPRGVMLHSTGADNPNLKRYVQPADADPNRTELYAVIGVNGNGNDWNRPGVNACVHGFIGKLYDGTVAAVQCLPWDHRGWHAGTGTSGRSANDTHISFEICEDDLTDPHYFCRVYDAAVELTAMLCREYGLDPLEEGVVISHREGHAGGVASNHADIDHWLRRFGKTMDRLRRDVAQKMEEEETMLTQEQFDAMLEDWLARKEEEPAADWGGEWEAARVWAEENGIIRGDEQGNKQYQSWTTRQAMVLLLYRLVEKLKGGEL